MIINTTKTMRAIIPCAGKGSRFSHKNKSLIFIKGKTVIEKLLNAIKIHMKDITIVVNSSNKSHFMRIARKYTGVSIVVDDSYSGTAEAIKAALKNSVSKKDIFIVWGDTIYKSKEFINNFLKRHASNLDYDMHIPVKYESNPYLAVLFDKNGIPFDVFYSREKGSRIPYGYHDLSTYIVKYDVLGYLNYINPAPNGEPHFLDLIKILYDNGKHIKAYEFFGEPVISFNTPEELKVATEKMRL